MKDTYLPFFEHIITDSSGVSYRCTAASQHVLIFTGGEHPSPVVTKAVLSSLAIPSCILAADSGFCAAQACGFIPDAVIGDLDSVPSYALSAAGYPSEKIQRFDTDKDETDTVLALEEAVRRGADYITLCGGDGGRLDHLLGIVKQFERAYFPHVWLCRHQAIFTLRSHAKAPPCRLTVSYEAASEHLSVFPIRTSCTDYRITSRGLLWDLEKVNWQSSGGFSLSNRISPDYAAKRKPLEITVYSGAFIVIVPYPARMCSIKDCV